MLLSFSIFTKSVVFSQTVAVLSFGWTPIILFGINSSSSIYTFVLCSLSFTVPKGVTEPFVKFKIDFSSSSLAKLKGLVLLSVLNFFISTFLEPFTVIK